MPIELVDLFATLVVSLSAAVMGYSLWRDRQDARDHERIVQEFFTLKAQLARTLEEYARGTGLPIASLDLIINGGKVREEIEYETHDPSGANLPQVHGHLALLREHADAHPLPVRRMEVEIAAGRIRERLELDLPRRYRRALGEFSSRECIHLDQASVWSPLRADPGAT